MSEQDKPTRDEIRDLVNDCGLDWRRGFAPLFDGDGTNRYEVLVRAAIAADRAEPAEKYDDTLLPFLHLMRIELHANSAKGDRPGWLTMDRNTTLLEIYWHTAKLSAACKNNDYGPIAEHCADVANMAMMLADVCCVLPQLASSPPADRAARVPVQRNVGIEPPRSGRLE